MRKTRKTRQIRMNDDEWEAFKTLLGAEWLRSKIASAIRRNRKPADETEYLLSSEANRARLMESIAQHKKSKDA